MNGSVGVKNSFDIMLATDDLSSTLKREALLLDKIAFHGFELVAEDKPSSVSEEEVNELLWEHSQNTHKNSHKILTSIGKYHKRRLYSIPLHP